MTNTAYSDITTHGVRVGATAFYLPDESNPDKNEYVFGYRIIIVNDSQRDVRLNTRRWAIIDADGHERIIEGEGVIGRNPELSPGEAFKYHSFAVLPTPWGTMEGSYKMRVDDDEEITVTVGRFFLTQDVFEHTRPTPPDMQETTSTG